MPLTEMTREGSGEWPLMFLISLNSLRESVLARSNFEKNSSLRFLRWFLSLALNFRLESL